MILPAKDPEEFVVATFSYASEIGAAAITGTPVISVAVAVGVDAAVGSMPYGAPTTSGSDVLQIIRLGVAGNDYTLRCLATLTDGRKLLRAATLPVRSGG